MRSAWTTASLAGLIFTLQSVWPAGTTGASCPITGFYKTCTAETVAADCASISRRSWPAAEPIRLGVSCTDVACPPPLPWCGPFPDTCHFSEGAAVLPGQWDVYRGVRKIGGAFHLTGIDCPAHGAVLEYDRLLEPDAYDVHFYGSDYFRLTIEGTLPPPSATPTATPTPRTCVGDCNEDRVVRIDELITGINLALERVDAAQCPAFDCMSRNVIPPVSCMTLAVNNALSGCQRD